jgi:hypothetical protein
MANAGILVAAFIVNGHPHETTIDKPRLVSPAARSAIALQ